MINITSVNNMKKSEEIYIKNSKHSYDLMEKAGISAASFIERKYKKVLILCGKGNNAGDGYVIANELLKDNIDVSIYLIEYKFSLDSLHFYNLIKDKVKTIINEEIDFNKYDLIIDCLLGTGFKGNLKLEYENLIKKINQINSYKISIDINSGIDSETGLTYLAFKSDLTIAIGYLKPGHILNMAKDYIKNIKIAPLNLSLIENPYYLIEEKDLLPLFKKRLNYSHKGNYGYDVLIGGSINYSGAPRLALIANSSVRSGAGVVKLAVPNSIAKQIIPYILDATLYPLSSNDNSFIFKEEEFIDLIKNTKSIAFGMGLMDIKETKKALIFLLNNYDKNLIIDADGINALSQIDLSILKNSKAKIILTPHLKEFSRLTKLSIQKINLDPINIALNFAKEYGLILILKGTATIITDGDKVYITNTGTPGMAKGGSGDVLSGVIAALVGFNDDILLASAGASYINGKAAEIVLKNHSEYTMTASDTALAVALAIDEIIKL